MIDKTFLFSVAAGAAASNIMPPDFNPVPGDGVMEIWGVTDGAIAGLTALPSVELKLGGATPATPLSQSLVPVQEFNIANAGPKSSDVVMSPFPVSQGQNTQLLLSGGTGATATGRFHVRFRTTAEVAAGL